MTLTIAKENQTRMARCDEHAWDYPQTFFPPPVAGQEGHWAGECPKCAEDRELSERANAQLIERHGEIAQEVFRLVQTHECEIEELTFREFDDYVARLSEDARQLLPMFEAAVRQRIYTEAWEQVADRYFQELVAQLRAGK